MRAFWHNISAATAVLGILTTWAVCPVSEALAENPPPEPPRLDAGDHQLAAGDYLLVQFFDGSVENQYYVQVDSAGEIVLPIIGTVAVKGLIPQQASRLVTDHYRQYYKSPFTSIQVINYGIIELYVFGPDHPGEIQRMTNGSRFSELLDRLEETFPGKHRRIHVIRDSLEFSSPSFPHLTGPQLPSANVLSTPSPDAVSRSFSNIENMQNWRPWIDEKMKDPQTAVWVIDPLQITVEGDLSRHNIMLHDNDVVFIPAPEKFVDISGVSNPGRYELLDDENLGDILRLAGTVNYYTDLSNAVIQRYDNQGHLQRVIFNLYPGLDDVAYIENFELCNRDVIKFVAREQRVFVLGEVNEAGAFDYQEDATVLDYIAQAKGETPEAHMSWIAIIRQSRDRINYAEEPEVIKVNFNEIHKSRPIAGDYSLLPGDVIYLPPKGFDFGFEELNQLAKTVLTGFVLVDSINNSTTPSE